MPVHHLVYVVLLVTKFKTTINHLWPCMDTYIAAILEIHWSKTFVVDFIILVTLPIIIM